MPIERIADLPYPDAVEDGPVKDYLLALRDALISNSALLAEDVETRLGSNIPTKSGTPTDNQIATWSSATNLIGESTLVYDGNNLHINDTANTKMTIGLNLNQGANDDDIIAFKSSDVAHGVTDLEETDTFGRIKKTSATEGGINLDGFTEGTIAIQLVGTGTTDNTTQGLTGRAYLETLALKKSGAGYTFPASGANIFAVRAYIYTSATASLLLVDVDGNLWTNGYVNTAEVYKVDGTQVVGPRVVDARCDDVINSGDATTDGVIDALRDAMITHGLIAAS